MVMKRWVILLFFLVYCPGTVGAVEIRAYVDRTRISLAESVLLSVVIENGEADVDISAIEDFKVLSKGSSTSVRIINFKMSKETTYTYTLIPLKTGELKIPALMVRSGKSTAHTQEITVFVSETPLSQDSAKDIWVTAEVSDNNPYQGQNIVYTFKLFHAVRITDAGFEKPDFKGFTAKQIDQERTYETVVAGRQYRVIEVKFVLIPLEKGRQVIEPAVLTCNLVKENGRSRRGFDAFFDDPFFGRARLEPRTFRTDALPVEVKPLPPYGLDIGFSGLVGSFNFSADLDGQKIGVGDSATLSLTVSGAGNIMDAEAPEVHLSDQFKVYRDNPEEDIRLDENGYSGKKVFRLALVPVKAGKAVVGPFELVYFNTDTGEYEKIRTRRFAIDVTPAAGKDRVETGQNDLLRLPEEFKKKKVEFIHRDILPLKEDLDALKTQREMSLSGFILLLLIPVFGYAAGKIFFLFVNKDEDDGMRMAKRARTAMKNAEKHKYDDDKLLSCLYVAFVSLVLSVAKAKGETLTGIEVEEILRNRGFPVEVRQQAKNFLNKIESCRYGGRVLDFELKNHLLYEIKTLARRLS